MSRVLGETITVLNDCGEAFLQTASAMFLQVGLLVVVLWLADLALRRRVGAVFRYWMWSLVLIELLLPVSLATPASPAYWMTDYRPYSAETVPAIRVEPVASSTAAPRERNGEQRSNSPLKSAPIAVPPPSVTGPSPPPVAAPPENHVAAAAPVEASSQPVPSANDLVRHEPLRPAGWLFCAWLAGVLIFAGICVRRTSVVRRLIRRSESAPAEIAALLDAGGERLGMGRNAARLRITDELGSPAVCGFWRPTILLPRHLLGSLEDDQFRLVFIHELTHWKRRDLQVNCLQTVLQVVHFYNPFVWFANAQLRRLREQAVDEAVLAALRGQSSRYSSTLLEIVTMMRRPADCAVQLIGVVESRHQLAQRIRRIVERPIPKSARLGLAGIGALAVAAVVLLPMAGGRPSGAADEKTVSKSGGSSASKRQGSEKGDSSVDVVPVLSGQILDDTALPVVDARVRLVPKGGGPIQEVKVDDEGRYSFSKLEKDGEYHLLIESALCISLERLNEAPNVELAAGRAAVRDVTLQRACVLKIKTVDEQGRPAGGVNIYAKCLGDVDGATRSAATDGQGIALIGLAPSDKEYVIGTWSRNFGFAKAVVRADNPDVVVEQTLVQRAGVDVEGKAVCSDGKPPAGWRVVALPDWWIFSSYPGGEEIRDDGSFTLRHVVPDRYTVKINIDKGDGFSTPRTVLTNEDITASGKPLELKCDFLSPSSLVEIAGTLKVTGGEHKGLWIAAAPQNGDIFDHGSAYVKPNETTFRIRALVPGKYTLRVQDPQIAPVEIKGVDAPSEGVELDIRFTSKPVIRGAVVRKDTQEPLAAFRVRARKIRTLRGANFVQDERWREIDNAAGEFELEVIGPGVYVVEASADGLAIARSGQINTDKMGDTRAKIEISAGIALRGSAVDEESRPVEGVRISVLSLSPSRAMRGDGGEEATPEATTDEEGRFQIEHLASEPLILAVAHPEFAFANARVAPDAGGGFPELEIVLQRGATIRGTVFDAAGRPQPLVTLEVDTQGLYRSLSPNSRGEHPTVVTDADGNYQIEHVPVGFSHVYRSDLWQAGGVVRRAVLTENGSVHRVDFGGPQKLSGRLQSNGTPLADASITLCDESPGQGIFTAFGKTGSDGSFEFFGVEPGEYTLSFSLSGRRHPWVRIRTVRLTSESADLGTIEFVAGKVSVRLEALGETPFEPNRITLAEYSPTWMYGTSVGRAAPPEKPGDPYVFDNVPPGDYQLNVRLPDYRVVMERVTVTPDRPHAELTVELPRGTASVQGTFEQPDGKSTFGSSLKLRSVDGHILEYIRYDDDGRYALDNLPAGDYFVTDKDLRDADRLVEFSLADNETKTLDITPDVIPQSTVERAFRVVRVVTPEGVPLPGCDIRLEGPGGTLLPNSNQYGRQSFVGPPGVYEMTIRYPGFETVRGTIELFVRGADGEYPKDLEIAPKLQRAR